MRRVLRALLLPLLGALPAGCTWIVHFNDEPGACDSGACLDASLPDVNVADVSVDASPDAALDARADGNASPGLDAGSCSGLPDGGVCGLDDPCHNAPTCVGGVCTPHPKADNTPCAAPLDACHTVPACTKGVCGPSKAQPQGYNWKPGDDNARCCGDGGVVMTNTTSNCGVCGIACGAGQTCGLIATHYVCLGCNGINSACWSDCCSATSGDHCAPGNCQGACASPDKCAKFGAHCQVDVVDYCTY